MKNYCNQPVAGVIKTKKLRHILLLALFSLLLGANPLLAKSAYSQSVQFNLNLRNASLEQVFDAIRHQSEFEFFYNNDQVDTKQRVNVTVKNGDIDEVLKQVLENRYNYEIKDRYILLTKNNTPVAEIRTVQQQTNILTGVVKDSNGEPMIGVSVLVKGTTQGGITDLDGTYKVQAKPGAVIVYSYIGYKTIERKLGAEKAINITLEEDSKVLEDVVIVGYGVQKKANLTGAVSAVKMDEVLGDRPIINVGAALQGAVPGLLVSGGHQVGQSKNLQIRGSYSLGVVNSDGSRGNSIAPLVLIDNVVGDLSMLNPDDIETISVLKDAASSAIYGARATGGVVIVTTKNAKHGNKFTLNYNNNISFESAISVPEQASLFDYFRMYKETGQSDSYWAAGQSIDTWVDLLHRYKANPSEFNIIGDGIYKNPADGKVYYLNESNSYKRLIETSFMQNHNLSVSGASEKIRFRISAGLALQDGPLVTNKDKYERNNIAAFISADITPWFTQEADIKYASTTQTNPSTSTGQVQVGLFGVGQMSFTPEGIIPADVYGLDGDYPMETSLSSLMYSSLPKTIRANPRIFTKSILKPFKGFEAIFEYTFDKKDTRYDFYREELYTTNIQESKKTPPVDQFTKQHYFTDYKSISAYATYTKSFENHNFKIMGGFNQESSYYEMLQAVVDNQDVKDIPAMNRVSGEKKPYDDYSEYSIRGGVFRFNYNYLGKYLFEANGRYDGSSKFPKDQRYGFFPSFSAGWNIAEESFLQEIGWLDGFKLRASWGKLGNQNISPYSFFPSMGSGVWTASGSNWLNNGKLVNFINPPVLVRNNFTWETVETIDFGVDFALFNSRLSGSFDWYQRNTNGMLAPGMDLPAVVGTGAPLQNTANMRTRGWEVSVNWNDQIGQVRYRAGFNLSDYKSVITKYDDNSSKILSDHYTGKELGEIWGYVSDGFYTIDDFEDTTSWKLKAGVTKIQGITNTLRPGDLKFKNLSDAGDQTPENTITTGANTVDNPGDRKILGNTTPRFQFGANLGSTYKGFDLSVVLQGVAKRDYWLGNSAYFPFSGGDIFSSVFSNQLNYWQPKDAANGDYTPINPNAKLPRIYDTKTASAWGSNTRVSDRFLSNAAYMRIKNVTLAYNFPKPIVSKMQISGLKFFVSIENLATFSSLPKGYDPETVSWTYPAYRTTSFGLSLTL